MMADEEPTTADAAAAEEVDVEQSAPEVEAEAETQAESTDAAPAGDPAVVPEVEAEAESAAEPVAEAEPEAEPAPEVGAEESAPEAVAAESEADAAESEGEGEAPEAASEADAAPAAESDADAEVGEDDGEAAPAAAAPPKPAPAEVIAPKERRRLKRAAKAPAARGEVTPEDRQVERDALRAHKAKARRTGRAKTRAAKPAAAGAAPLAVEHAVGRPRARQGIVVSDKAAKTITVRVDTSRRHRRYKKIVRSSKTLHAHDEHDEAHEGDLVRVVETRPLSATKRWRLLEVLERAK
jgi:small subunit ribosomal protein S17